MNRFIRFMMILWVIAGGLLVLLIVKYTGLVMTGLGAI